MRIYAFLNEESILKNIYDSEFIIQFKNVIKMMTFLADSKKYNSNFCFSQKLYSKHISDGKKIVSSVISRQKDLYMSYQLLMSKGKKQWDLTPIHNHEIVYTYNGIGYQESSVAEATEYTIIFKKDFSFLLDFSDTIFRETKFDINKGDFKISVNCASCEEMLLALLKDKGVLSTYTDDCKYSPRDIQTVLVDSTKFKLTNLINHGRKVYRRINHDELWCVDNYHTGGSAHIEVFSGNHTFKGTSHINFIDNKLKAPKKNDIGRVIEP